MCPRWVMFFTLLALSAALSEALHSVLVPASVSSEVRLDSTGSYAEANTYDVSRPVKVIMWSKFLMRNPEWMRSHVPNCTLQRAFERTIGAGNVTVDPDYDISDADVVLFNLAPLEQLYILPRKKWPGQLWIAGCWEPPIFDGDDIGGDCSLLSDHNTMQWMDGVASYDNTSAFPAFFTPPTEQQMRRPAPDSAWLSGPMVEYSSSDCRVASRNDWVAAVNRSLIARNAEGVLSFGKCLHTAEEQSCSGPEAVSEPADDSVEEWTFIKYANRCMARPFTLVSENSMAPWYVTEKVWNALAAGSVPVYSGPPEVKLLVPPGSIIYAGDYNTTDELVDAMLRFDLAAHKKAREFKDQTAQSWGMWSRARELSRATLMARLCAAVVVGDKPRQLQALPSAPAPPPSFASQQPASSTGVVPAVPLDTENVWMREVLKPRRAPTQPRAGTTSPNISWTMKGNSETGSHSENVSTPSAVASAAVGGQSGSAKASGGASRLRSQDVAKVTAGGASAEAIWQQQLAGISDEVNGTAGATKAAVSPHTRNNINRTVVNRTEKHPADSSAQQQLAGSFDEVNGTAGDTKAAVPPHTRNNISRAVVNGTEKQPHRSRAEEPKLRSAQKVDGFLRRNGTRGTKLRTSSSGRSHRKIGKVGANKTAEPERPNAEDRNLTTTKIDALLKRSASNDGKTRKLLRRLAEIKESETK